MSIQNTPFEGGPMTALASQRAIDLNLPVANLDMSKLNGPLLKAAQDKYTAQQELAKQSLANQGALAITSQQGQNSLNTTNLQNQGQLANTQQQGQQDYQRQQLVGNQQIQNTQLQGQNTLANTQLSNQGQLANTQQQGANSTNVANIEQVPQMIQAKALAENANTEQAKASEDITKDKFAMNMGMNNYKLNMRGKVGSMLLMGINQYSNDPQKLGSYVQSQADNALSEGLIDQNEHDYLISNASNPDNIKNAAMGEILMSGTAGTAKDAGLGAGDIGVGGQLGSNGQPTSVPLGNIYGVAPADSKAAIAQQTNAGLQIMNTQQLVKNFTPELFQWSGEKDATLGWLAGKSPGAADLVNRSLGALGAGSDIANDKQLAAINSTYQSDINSNILGTMKQLGITRPSVQLLNLLHDEVPTIGPKGDAPEEAFNKTVAMVQRNNRAIAFAQGLQKQNLNTTNPDAYQQQVENYMSKDTSPGKLTFTIPNGPNKGQQQDMNYDEVSKLAKAQGVSFGQAFQYVVSHP